MQIAIVVKVVDLRFGCCRSKKSNDPKKVDINFFSSMSRFQRPLFISTSIKNCFFANGGNFFFAEVGESPERNCEKARPRISDALSKSRQKKSIPRNLDSSSTLSVGRPLFCWLIYQRLQRWRELGPLSLSLSLSLPLSHSLSLAGLSRRTAKNLTATKLKDCFLFGVRSAKKIVQYFVSDDIELEISPSRQLLKTATSDLFLWKNRKNLR